MKAIIEQENVVHLDSHSGVKIYGGFGCHAQDLLKRNLLVGTSDGEKAHIITLPIPITELGIIELLEKGIRQDQVVSCAGVMTKTTNGVPSVHYLFGPGAKDDLKLAVAQSSKHMPPLVQALIERASEKGLRIIETTRTEHDQKMAVIQGLVHIWIILSGTAHEDNSELKNEVVTPWKTPATTVIDMIHANPFAEEVIKDFFDILPRYDYDLRVALMVTVDKHLSEKDQHDFGTPNLTRVMNFIAKNIHPLKIGREKLDDTRKALNTSGYSFLRNQIGILRPIKTP